MTRARCCLGSIPMRERFEQVRRDVIHAPRDRQALQAEIVAMRDKLRAAYPIRPGEFDVKHSPGGMIDAEFVVQYLVLAQTSDHPELGDNVGNITLLQRAEQAGLLPPAVGHAAADAYRELRKAQHRARLDEQLPRVENTQLADERNAILRLWSCVLGAAPTQP
jgi:[glutamine synthetase] adenylyltransferase / [glutamine synthetase]-adenylyl-L-tyrosine phosphorylase